MHTLSFFIYLDELPQMLTDVHAQDVTTQLNAVTKSRKLLSIGM